MRPSLEFLISIEVRIEIGGNQSVRDSRASVLWYGTSNRKLGFDGHARCVKNGTDAKSNYIWIRILIWRLCVQDDRADFFVLCS